MTEKISQYFMYAMVAIGVIITIIGMTGESYDGMLFYSYILFGLCVVMAVLGAVVGTISNPSGLKGTLIGIVSLLALIGISYALADGSVHEKWPEDTTETVSKWSGVGLYAFYILFFGAFVAIIVSSIGKLVK